MLSQIIKGDSRKSDSGIKGTVNSKINWVIINPLTMEMQKEKRIIIHATEKQHQKIPPNIGVIKYYGKFGTSFKYKLNHNNFRLN